jgi:hypothetical protein
MTHLIAGYIFVGACYATAAWTDFCSDLKNKALLADLKTEKALLRVVFVFLLVILLAAVAIAWPFLLLTNLFILLQRHLSATNAK